MLNPQLDRRPVSMMRRVMFAVVLLCAALPIAAASQAMSTPSGTVSDPMGRPLANAVMRLTTVGNSEQMFETRTDDNGTFQFAPVPAGEYMLAVRYPGFSASRQRMQLSGGGTTITLRVQVGTLQERITVTGGPGGNGPRNVQTAPAPAPQACTPSVTGGQVTPPMKIRDVRPRYRQEWIDAKVEGVILLQARIGTDGAVKGVDVISPVNVDLEDEAMAAVSQWQFTPTYLNCEPVEVQMYVTVAFKTEQ